MTAVIGLDLSLTSTGVCDADGNVRTYGGNEDLGDRRLDLIGGAIYALVGGGTSGFATVDLAVIEDLPRGAMGGSSTGMVQGVVRYVLREASVHYALVPAATLKMYATGKGTASKVEMALAAYKRAEMEFANDDECDAWWLRCMGLDYLGSPLFDLPAGHRKALTKARWPEDR